MSVPRTAGRCFVLPGSTQTQGKESSVLPPPEQDESGCTPDKPPPSRLSRSWRRCIATLRFNPPVGPLPACLYWHSPPKETFQQRREQAVGLSRASPWACDGAGL